MTNINFGALQFQTSNLKHPSNGFGRRNPFADLPKEINKLLGDNAKHYTYQCKGDDTQYTFFVNHRSADKPEIVEKLNEFEDTFVTRYPNVKKTNYANNPILPESVEKIDNPVGYKEFLKGHFSPIWE